MLQECLMTRIFAIELIHILNMVLGYNQNVLLSDRSNITKSYTKLILIAQRLLIGDYLTKFASFKHLFVAIFFKSDFFIKIIRLVSLYRPSSQANQEHEG